MFNRPVKPGEEPVEFRPIPGQEGDWAGADYVVRSPLWYWAGIYPIALYLVMVLVLMGMAAV